MFFSERFSEISERFLVCTLQLWRSKVDRKSKRWMCEGLMCVGVNGGGGGV